MEAVFGLLLMLLGVSHGVEIICDVQQEGGAQCYGALGGTVILKMKDRSPARFEIRKNATAIFRWANNNISLNTLENRSLFTPSAGTFRINNLIKSDSDEYKLKISDSGGKTVLDQTLRLSIQAPVLSVRLVSKCLSQGEMRVSCVSEGGDSLQYRWTLNGRTLSEDRLLNGTHETDNITLKQDVSGSLGCSVKNHVSDRERVEIISTCGFIFIDCIDSNETHISQWVFAANNTLCVDPTTKAPDTTVAMAGVLAALAVLLLVGGAVIYALKKKKNHQPEEDGDEKELTYSEVRIVQRGRVQQRVDPDVEVEYGQIKFSKRPRRTVELTEDDCVYAKVR
ncbi:uncharacterized protein [Paralichthys olivaceus]|uniref:uncharacterized protein isoform X2 n=1 Tax=Paralichthys olivaceus TaxID=8255 RepID=UPI0037528DF2